MKTTDQWHQMRNDLNKLKAKAALCDEMAQSIETALRWMSSYGKWNKCDGAKALRAAISKHNAIQGADDL